MPSKDKQSGCFCPICGHQKILYKLFKTGFCFFCKKKTSNQFRLFTEPAHFIMKLGPIRMRHRRPGFRKFLSESLGGWFPSGDKRLPDGVEKSRMINRETNEYHEIVKKYGTDEIIHEKHEPLNQHKK
jgi:hypothetical protein